MTKERPSDDQVRRVAEAATWRTRLTELGQESSLEFEAWLAEDSANEAAWRQVEAPLALFADHAAAPRLIAARRDALDRAHRHSRSALPAWTRIAAGLAVVGLVSIFLVGLNWWNARPDVYATGHAERRIVRLADGSRVSLDAETELKVHLGRDARQLELMRGQARFDVAHDVTRPFSVRAGDQTVIATGTAFNIDMLGPRVLVTLIEGRVEVVPAHAQPVEGLRRPTTLAAGQQLAVAPRAPPILRQADLSSATAWTNGQLVFTDEPLSSVVARLARYSDHPITVSPGAATLRVSGVFQTDDVDGFVRSITAYLPLRAERTADGGVLLDRRG